MQIRKTVGENKKLDSQTVKINLKKKEYENWQMHGVDMGKSKINIFQ